MPNLVAIVDPAAARADLEGDLERMIEAVDIPSFGFEVRRVAVDGSACGNVLPGMNDNRAQPVWDPSGTRWLMLDGEILNGRELRYDLRRAGLPTDTEDDAELAMLCFRAFGVDFFERLKGTWNLVLYDGSTGHTYLVTDRLGSRLVFFARDGDRFVFANELKGVIAGRKVPSRPGGVGLYALLMAGAHHGDRTWIDGIRLVPPGTVIRLGPDGRWDRRYWRFSFREGGPEMSEDDYADGFARLMRTATERCMKGSDRFDVAITLSGGLDSRAVALSVDASHLPMRAITYGDEDSADVRYARQLAEVIGLDHLYIERERERLIDEAEAAFREITGRREELGFFSVQADRIIWRAEALSGFDGLASPIWHPIYRRYMRFMLNGAAGDAMTGSHLTPKLLLFPNREDVVRDTYRGFFWQDPGLVESVLNRAFVNRVRPQLEPNFLRDFDEIDADEAMAVANIWDMENRQRRGAFTSFTMERYFCDCRSPFLDYDLCDFLARIPGRWRFQQRIYKRMLVKHYPEAAHVPWAYTEGRITASPTFEFGREAFNYLERRVRAALPGRKGARAHYDFRDVTGMMQRDEPLHRQLVAFTESDHFPSEVLDAAGVRRFVDEFAREGGGHRSVLFAHLYGIARSMEFFLVPGRIRIPPTADPARFGVPTL